MTDADLEILIYAGIAAGLKFVRLSDDKTALLMEGVEEPWNPLADDGDALRLAVTLGINVLPGKGNEAWTRAMGLTAYAATRRAITRAAAEIGKQMGGGHV